MRIAFLSWLLYDHLMPRLGAAPVTNGLYSRLVSCLRLCCPLGSARARCLKGFTNSKSPLPAPRSPLPAPRSPLPAPSIFYSSPLLWVYRFSLLGLSRLCVLLPSIVPSMRCATSFMVSLVRTNVHLLLLAIDWVPIYDGTIDFSADEI